MTTNTLCPVETLVRASVALSDQATTEVSGVLAGCERRTLAFLENAEILTLLENFSLLDTKLAQHAIQVSSLTHKDCSVEVEIPLYGWLDLGHAAPVIYVYNDTFQLKETTTTNEVLGKVIQQTLLLAALKLLAAQVAIKIPIYKCLYDAREYSMIGRGGLEPFNISYFRPKVPKDVEEIAKQASAFGFADLAMVWGPLELQVKKIPRPDPDPLLVGKRFDRWWILHRWGMTPVEQKLVVPE